MICPGTSVEATNPFAIDVPEKKDITNEDYINIQKQLRAIDIIPLLRKLYPENQGYTTFEDFKSRCTRGLTQNLIDPEKGLFPTKNLEKIGNGSDMCIVSCCTSFDGIHPKLIKDIPKALKECGFNGYFYHRVGGYPNPTGKEIKYVGVPYSFKIFLMLEAQQLGFNKVMWVDSRILPLRDPSPLFSRLDIVGSVLLSTVNPKYDNSRIFPKTRRLLKKLTGTDVVKEHISTQVFGLKMDSERAKDFVKSYYEFADMGTPFLSCFPEEFVFGAIVGKSRKDWPTLAMSYILQYPVPNENQASINAIRDMGFYFYLRTHDDSLIKK